MSELCAGRGDDGVYQKKAEVENEVYFSRLGYLAATSDSLKSNVALGT